VYRERSEADAKLFWLGALGLLVLRLAFGGTMLLVHGLDKVMRYGDMAPKFFDPFGLGGHFSLALVIFAEVACALAVVLGLLTRLAVIPLIVEMAMAFFMVHGKDSFQVKELALLYLAAFVVLLLTGPGPLSADRFIWRRRRR
jgi:putative oxidoreductase